MEFLTSEKMTSLPMTTLESKLLVDALETVIAEQPQLRGKLLRDINSEFLSIEEKLRVALLKGKLSESLRNSILLELVDKKDRLIYLIASHEKELLSMGEKDLIRAASSHDSYFSVTGFPRKPQPKN